MPISTHNIGEFEAKISIDIQQTWYFFVTFYVFWNVISKKRKKSCFFLKSEKNIKYVAYSRTLSMIKPVTMEAY